MADAVTPTYSWAYPTNGADAATWGNTLNGTIIAIDAQMALMAPKASPTFTGTVTAPTFTGALVGNASTATTATTANGVAAGSVAPAGLSTGHPVWDVGGDLSITAALNVGGATVLAATGLTTLTASGAAALNGGCTTTTLAATGAITGAAITASTTLGVTGLASLNGGANITPAAAPATNAVGYLGAPVNEQDAGYIFVMADAGKMVRGNNGSAMAYTIPPHASVAFPVGTAIVLRNVGAGVITITRGAAVTQTIAGAGTSKDVALAQYGMATLIQESTDSWIISGIGIS